MNRFRKWWCNNFHIWQSRIATEKATGEEFYLSQCCDKCKRMYITNEAVLLFQETEKGEKFLSEAVYSVFLKPARAFKPL